MSCPYNWKGGGGLHSILPEPQDQTNLEESPWKTRTPLYAQQAGKDADELIGNKVWIIPRGQHQTSTRIQEMIL